MARHLVVLTFFCFAQWHLWAQTGFTITISMRQAPVVSGAPVRLHIDYVNNWDKTVWLPTSNVPLMMSGIVVKDSNGRTLVGSHEPKAPAYLHHHGFGVEPGKRAVEEMDIDRIYDLTRPGAYTVYLDKKFGPGPNETKSNEITFTIIK
ncbi:MAG TPA: hypothetical protein VGG80_10775 [Acidobacteriaceae bacterium]|jgi:hypothetical protein